MIYHMKALSFVILTTLKISINFSQCRKNLLQNFDFLFNFELKTRLSNISSGYVTMKILKSKTIVKKIRKSSLIFCLVFIFLKINFVDHA